MRVFCSYRCVWCFFITEDRLGVQWCHLTSELKNICTVTLTSAAIWYRGPNPHPSQTGLALSMAPLCPALRRRAVAPNPTGTVFPWQFYSTQFIPHQIIPHYSTLFIPTNSPGLPWYSRLVFCPRFLQRAGVVRDKPSASFQLASEPLSRRCAGPRSAARLLIYYLSLLNTLFSCASWVTW